MEFRKALGYPPFSRMIQLRIQGKDQGHTVAQAKLLGRRCAALQQARSAYARVELLGPLEAPLSRIAEHYRWQMLLKSPLVKPLHSLVHELLMGADAVPKRQGVAVTVDVDPLFLM